MGHETLAVFKEIIKSMVWKKSEGNKKLKD